MGFDRLKWWFPWPMANYVYETLTEKVGISKVKLEVIYFCNDYEYKKV